MTIEELKLRQMTNQYLAGIVMPTVLLDGRVVGKWKQKRCGMF